MRGLLIVSPQPFSGKTAVAAGIARRLRSQGGASLARTGDDANAAADSALFQRLSPGGEVTITEAPAGETSPAAGAQVVAVVRGDYSVDEVVAYARSAGPLAGVVVTRVPEKRLAAVRTAYAAANMTPLAVLAEDAVLASPTVGQLAAALGAEGEYVSENADRVVDRPVIASIAADPGQSYFDRTDAGAVIVRSDKPDLQLAALNAGANCLIVTGGLPVLSYVLERVADDEVPLLRTKLDTKETVAAIEELFSSAPFAGGEDKLRRMESLLEGLDLDALLERAANPA